MAFNNSLMMQQSNTQQQQQREADGDLQQNGMNGASVAQVQPEQAIAVHRHAYIQKTDRDRSRCLFSHMI